jgi:hypothetical protein
MEAPERFVSGGQILAPEWAVGGSANGSGNVSGWRCYRTRERLTCRPADGAADGPWRRREAGTVTDPGWDIPGIARDEPPAAADARAGAAAGCLTARGQRFTGTSFRTGPEHRHDRIPVRVMAWSRRHASGAPTGYQAGFVGKTRRCCPPLRRLQQRADPAGRLTEPLTHAECERPARTLYELLALPSVA